MKLENRKKEEEETIRLFLIWAILSEWCQSHRVQGITLVRHIFKKMRVFKN